MDSKTVRYRSLTLSLVLAGALALAACTGSETLQRGYVLPDLRAHWSRFPSGQPRNRF